MEGISIEIIEGLVIRAVRGNYIVDSHHQEWVCSVRGNLKKDLVFSESASRAAKVISAARRRVTNPVTVGDQVFFQELSEGVGVIEEVLPRRSAVVRYVPRERESQVIVANIDLFLVVFSAIEPRLDPWKLDRFLVASISAGLDPVIAINKMDLEVEPELQPLIDAYRKAGYHVITLSAKEGDGVQAVMDLIHSKIAAFSGPSGVGKSSLLNAICPEIAASTGEVGKNSKMGRHTTTRAQLYRIDKEDTWVADTPGLRNLEFWQVEPEAIDAAFPEIEPHLGGCRFNNCKHDSEPGCPLREAVEQGLVDLRRYKSYLQLSQEVVKKPQY